MKTIPQVYVGVDVSKDHLDIHVHPQGKSFRIKNTTKEINKLARNLANLPVSQIVFESSGGYEFLLNKILNAASYSTWIVDPKRIRNFRLSEGIKVKTDAEDAKIIAQFASEKKRSYQELEVPTDQSKLRAFVRRKQDIAKMIATEKKRLKHPQQEHCVRDIKKTISFLEKQVKQLEMKIDALIKKNQEWCERSKIMQSVPGIGPGASSALLSHMPELGHIEGKQATALLGVAPYNNESGQFKGKAFIRDGRALPRHALYMAALTASRSNPILSKFYRKLIDMGKKPKVALIAIMRKLIIVINAMLHKSELWRIPEEKNLERVG